MDRIATSNADFSQEECKSVCITSLSQLAHCALLFSETSCPSSLCYLLSYHRKSSYHVTVIICNYWKSAPCHSSYYLTLTVSYLYDNVHHKVSLQSPNPYVYNSMGKPD